MRLFADLRQEGKPRHIRVRGVFRRYLDLLGQIDFHEQEGTFATSILVHLKANVAHDLQDFLRLYPNLLEQVQEWRKNRMKPGGFSDQLTKELLPK